MSQTDAQAALAAATAVIVAMIESSNYSDDKTPYQIEQHACQMATGLLRWLQRPGRTMVERHVDERLVPNEDFRSPGQAQTERVDASAVLAAAADPTMPWRTVSGAYIGPHVKGGPACVTPSGAYACLCGQKWPCSQIQTSRRIAGLPT